MRPTSERDVSENTTVHATNYAVHSKAHCPGWLMPENLHRKSSQQLYLILAL